MTTMSRIPTKDVEEMNREELESLVEALEERDELTDKQQDRLDRANERLGEMDDIEERDDESSLPLSSINDQPGLQNHLLAMVSTTSSNGVVDATPPTPVVPVVQLAPPIHIETLLELRKRLLAEHNAKTALLEAEILFAGVNEAGAAILNANSGFMVMSTRLLTNVTFEMWYSPTTKLWIAGREHITNHVAGAKPVSNTTTPGVRAARGDTTMVVNGISYPTASAAVHALCPETLKKPMSRDQIGKYLTRKGHDVLAIMHRH